MTLALAGTLITCVTIVCGTLVAIFKPKEHTQLPGCHSTMEALNTRITNEILHINTKVDSAIRDSWREVELSKKDRADIRERVFDETRSVVQLETEMKGVHNEMREIKEALAILGNKLDKLIIDTPKRGENGFDKNKIKP